MPGIICHSKTIPVSPPYCILEGIGLPVHVEMEARSGSTACVTKHEFFLFSLAGNKFVGVISYVLFSENRQLWQILHGSYVRRTEIQPIHQLSIIKHIFVSSVDQFT